MLLRVWYCSTRIQALLSPWLPATAPGCMCALNRSTLLVRSTSYLVRIADCTADASFVLPSGSVEYSSVALPHTRHANCRVGFDHLKFGRHHDGRSVNDNELVQQQDAICIHPLRLQLLYEVRQRTQVLTVYMSVLVFRFVIRLVWRKRKTRDKRERQTKSLR